MKTVYYRTTWSEYNTTLINEGWELYQTLKEGVRLKRHIPDTIPFDTPPWNEYLKYLTRNAIRYVLAPIKGRYTGLSKTEVQLLCALGVSHIDKGYLVV